MRYRRLDGHNFVVETQTEGKSGRWVIEGYYANLDSLLRAALRLGVFGDSPKELAASLAGSEATVLAALNQAIESGAISEPCAEGPCAVRRISKARAASIEHVEDARGYVA